VRGLAFPRPTLSGNLLLKDETIRLQRRALPPPPPF